VEAAAKVIVRNELEPMKSHFRELNDWLNAYVIDVERYEMDVQDARAQQER